jgi:hypothetical protein
LFERTANSWAEFESMLARLILAAIMQKCLEVEAEREEEERKAKVAMHSSEHDDLLLEELLADDEGDKKKKKSKKKKKKADVEERKEPEADVEAEAEPEDEDEAEQEAEDPPLRSAESTDAPAGSRASAARNVEETVPVPTEDPEASEDAETVLTSACWSTVQRKKSRKKPQPLEAPLDPARLSTENAKVTPPSLTHARADSSSTIKSKGSHEVVTTPSLSHARADSSSTWKSKGSQEAGADPQGVPEKGDTAQAVSAASQHDSTRASSRGSTPTPKAAVDGGVGQASCATAQKPEIPGLPWSSGVTDGKHFWAYNCGAIGGSGATIVASMHRTFLSVSRQVTRRGRRASI